MGGKLRQLFLSVFFNVSRKLVEKVVTFSQILVRVGVSFRLVYNIIGDITCFPRFEAKGDKIVMTKFPLVMTYAKKYVNCKEGRCSVASSSYFAHGL